MAGLYVYVYVLVQYSYHTYIYIYMYMRGSHNFFSLILALHTPAFNPYMTFGYFIKH